MKNFKNAARMGILYAAQPVKEVISIAAGVVVGKTIKDATDDTAVAIAAGASTTIVTSAILQPAVNSIAKKSYCGMMADVLGYDSAEEFQADRMPF